MRSCPKSTSTGRFGSCGDASAGAGLDGMAGAKPGSGWSRTADAATAASGVASSVAVACTGRSGVWTASIAGSTAVSNFAAISSTGTGGGAATAGGETSPSVMSATGARYSIPWGGKPSGVSVLAVSLLPRAFERELDAEVIIVHQRLNLILPAHILRQGQQVQRVHLLGADHEAVSARYGAPHVGQREMLAHFHANQLILGQFLIGDQTQAAAGNIG